MSQLSGKVQAKVEHQISDLEQCSSKSGAAVHIRLYDTQGSVHVQPDQGSMI